MSRVQVVYASRHGGTAGIAERIGQTLRSEGVEVAVVDAAERPDPIGFDAFVVGSGVQIGSWYKEGTTFLEENRAILATSPVWLFSSGPLPGSAAASEGTDRLTDALGPQTGPGSGGRKRIDALSAAIQPRDHQVFDGAYDPSDRPASLAERVVRLAPASKRILPAGDFRDWDAIDRWARGIAIELGARVPVG